MEIMGKLLAKILEINFGEFPGIIIGRMSFQVSEGIGKKILNKNLAEVDRRGTGKIPRGKIFRLNAEGILQIMHAIYPWSNFGKKF